MSTDEFALPGLRGENPLAFLAALGALRVAAGIYGAAAVHMRWSASSDAWSPILRVPARVADEAGLALALHAWMGMTSGKAAFDIADDLTLTPLALRNASLAAVSKAHAGDRDLVDFIAAFGCDAVEAKENGKPSGKMADTAFRTMSGAGHQHFLGFMRTLAADCTPHHLQRTLFEPWQYNDPLESHTMRWDPTDDVRYALRWRDSSGDPERKRAGTMWGANRLAIEALPMLPTMPVAGGQLGTVGYRATRADGTAWTWPLWDAWSAMDAVKSLLALKKLQVPHPPRHELARLGVAEVFRCYRIRQGKYRNLTPSKAV